MRLAGLQLLEQQSPSTAGLQDEDEAPLGVDDERFVTTWVHYCHDLMTGTST